VTRQPDTGGAGSLDLAIEREAEVPIGVQLAWALRAHIHDGRLTAGQRLPGLRDLAQALKINANTVRAVYQRLEHEGMIESHQGSGTYVTATARKSATAGAIAASAAREAHQTGVDPREVAAALYVEAAASQTQPRDRTVERRRELRTQIAALEQVLGKIEAEHPGLVPASRARIVRGPRLLDVEDLELTQNHLIRRLAAIQAARDALRDEQPTSMEQTHEAPAPPQRAARRAKTRPAPAGA
jgi:GntR family transcriptional regulator